MVRLAPSLYKFVLNGVDITNYVYSFDVTKMKNQSISTAKIVLNSKIESIMTITDAIISSSLTVQRGFSSSTERYIYRGEVTTYSYKGSIGCNNNIKISATGRKNCANNLNIPVTIVLTGLITLFIASPIIFTTSNIAPPISVNLLNPPIREDVPLPLEELPPPIVLLTPSAVSFIICTIIGSVEVAINNHIINIGFFSVINE